MKTRLLIIIGIFFAFSTLSDSVFADELQDVMRTKFDVNLSNEDFTTQGPNHNILVLNRGNSTEINISVKNNDDVSHTIRFHSPTDSDSSTFSMFKFEPKEILVLPNQVNSTKLYMTVSNQTDTHTTFVTFLGQSDVFGMKGLGFYLVVDDEFIQWTDFSLRAGLPGPAFPYLDTETSEDNAEKIIKNGLGTPKYIPQGYQFRGVTDWGDSQQFVYSKSAVSNQTESIQFWKDDGLMIFYSVDGPNVNNTQSLPFKVAQDEGQQIMINGLLGAATEQTSRIVMESDFTYKVPADLYFFDDNEKFSVSIRANLSLDEILKVAESIPRLSSNQHQEQTDGNINNIFNSKNGTGLVTLKKGQEVDVIFNYDFRNDKIFDGYVYYNIAEAGQLISQSQNFTISEIPKTFKFSYTPQNVGIFSFTKGAMSHTGVSSGEQTQFIAVVEKFSKAMEFNGQCKKPFPEFSFVIKPDFSTIVCVTMDTKQILKERGWH